MRVLSKNITKSGALITMIAQTTEDIWHMYNLVSINDHIRTQTIRKIQKDSTIGVPDSERKVLTLSICVKKIDFDPTDCTLRLSGQVSQENKWVKLGSYHTLEIPLLKKLVLYKHTWNQVSLLRLEEAANESKKYQVVVVIMQEGLANICVITEFMTITKARITLSIPRKNKSSHSLRAKAIENFFSAIYDALIKNTDLDQVKVVIIASPGFIKDEFYKFLLAYGEHTQDKVISRNQQKFLLLHSNSGHRHALNELLTDKSVMSLLNDMKAVEEVTILQRFLTIMKKEPDRCLYGRKHVQLALKNNAISHLLLSDDLLRAKSIALRKEYASIVERVKANGGNVHIFSTMHVSGEQLSRLTGIAAILYFPLYNLDDQLEESDIEEKQEIDSEEEGCYNLNEHPIVLGLDEVEDE
ncbi:protein pelota homolog [Schistocerca gregaria]|uniref:protein pelota homolog n=1 Tax=Schistocerca gregaria TaxID=7010 RepID=UPI00211DE26D|nr:protein pelota homolog [Schistocerca gregaria]